eukprot:1176130-Prorocentrum_minimum.AAC.5
MDVTGVGMDVTGVCMDVTGGCAWMLQGGAAVRPVARGARGNGGGVRGGCQILRPLHPRGSRAAHPEDLPRPCVRYIYVAPRRSCVTLLSHLDPSTPAAAARPIWKTYRALVCVAFMSPSGAVALHFCHTGPTGLSGRPTAPLCARPPLPKPRQPPTQ